MKLARHALLAASALALTMGAAHAKEHRNDPGFNVLDKDNDGYLTRTEAAANPYLSQRFRSADKDGDGKLSRAEYLAVMAQRDLASAGRSVDQAVSKKEDPATSDDPGFNNLDKDNDGVLTRAEAAGNPYLLERFDEADSDGDGKISRVEYLRVMAAKDLDRAREGVANVVRPDENRDSSPTTGGAERPAERR
jgi:Ca2+-binding EF-hand superfamily protein